MLKKVIDWFEENIAKASAGGHLNYTVTIHAVELQEMLDELRKVKKSIQGGFSPPKEVQ